MTSESHGIVLCTSPPEKKLPEQSDHLSFVKQDKAFI
jgi:hypothetical protein